MHRASLTLTLRVVELTLRLSFEKHHGSAAERPGITIRETARPLAKTRGPVLQLKAAGQ